MQIDDWLFVQALERHAGVLRLGAFAPRELDRVVPDVLAFRQVQLGGEPGMMRARTLILSYLAAHRHFSLSILYRLYYHI